jgi:ubiquitin-conjugating enzyme E2 J1
METDARGQLGGLETTDVVRKRLAAESPAFKCAICGKTNGQIIQECEERTKESSSTAQEIEVPKDLNMGWRDEMEAKNKSTANTEMTADDAESAELAEGFVQTVPPPNSLESVPASTSDQSTPRPPSDIRLPTPTRTTPLPAAAAAATVPAPEPVVGVAAPPQPARRASDDGVPLWLDRLIVVMVVLLVALVLKILFAL